MIYPREELQTLIHYNTLCKVYSQQFTHIKDLSLKDILKSDLLLFYNEKIEAQIDAVRSAEALTLRVQVVSHLIWEWWGCS